MKKILLSLVTIVAVGAIVANATTAYFSDSEVLGDNTFAAGSLDLKVNGGDDVLHMAYSAKNLVPGETVNGGIVTLKNSGSIDGLLTVQVSNPSSNENGEIEPEISSGDVAGTEVDPTGYDANTGEGELWDMASMTIYFDTNRDGVMQWNEPTVWVGDHLDMTSYYSIHLDSNLWTANHGFDGILGPDEEVDLRVLVKFKSDTQLASQPQYIGLNNNMAMTDDMSFDLIVGLDQVVTP